MKNTPKRMISVYLPLDIYEKLQVKSQYTSRSISKTVELLIRKDLAGLKHSN